MSNSESTSEVRAAELLLGASNAAALLPDGSSVNVHVDLAMLRELERSSGKAAVDLGSIEALQRGTYDRIHSLQLGFGATTVTFLARDLGAGKAKS